MYREQNCAPGAGYETGLQPVSGNRHELRAMVDQALQAYREYMRVIET